MTKLTAYTVVLSKSYGPDYCLFKPTFCSRGNVERIGQSLNGFVTFLVPASFSSFLSITQHWQQRRVINTQYHVNLSHYFFFFSIQFQLGIIDDFWNYAFSAYVKINCTKCVEVH